MLKNGHTDHNGNGSYGIEKDIQDTFHVIVKCGTLYPTRSMFNSVTCTWKWQMNTNSDLSFHRYVLVY